MGAFQKIWSPINRMLPLQLIKWTSINIMKDNSDIPLPADELKSKVLVFAITDEATHQYEQITKGYVELSTDEDEKNHTFHYLQVKDQLTNEVLMRSNLKLENNFGKQKGSIISWTDEQQPQYQEIALSFQKDRECDMFWRTICEKIGKSYLQINGMEKLETPNSNNLNYILEKAKNSIDLIDYNIVHSKSIMEGLRDVFYEMKKNNDQFGMGTVLRIIHAIMCPTYSSNAIQILLTGQNFYMILDLQQFRKSINFRQIYEKKVSQYLKNKFNLPRDIFEKVELSHRATFYRQNVLDLAEDSLLQSMMFMICKQALIQIMSYLNRAKFLQSVTKYPQYPNPVYKLTNDSTEGEFDTNITPQQLNNDKIHFIHEALNMYNQINSEQIKISFKQNIYSSGVLTFIKQNIENDNTKALEILFCINQIDKQKFFEHIIQDFKQNSSDNLLKTLMKKYVNQSIFRGPIIALIESISPLFNLKKELFDFFNGTFVCSVFSVAKDSRSVLLLANVLLAQLQNSSILFSQFIKLKICEKIAAQYRNGGLKTKVQELQILKFVKYMIIEQCHKGQAKNKEIEKNIIESGLFECCMMIYFKHSQRCNVLSSSMLENLKIIEKMEFSQFDAFLIKEYSTNESLQKIIKPIRAKYIEYMNKNAQKNHGQEYLEVQRMAHEQILQNEQQDSYLMNQDQQNLTVSLTNQQTPNGKDKHDQQEQNKDLNKEDSLVFLKRMMDEIKQDEEETIKKEPRKIVKKSQDSKQTAIQFCFDLPDMDQIEENDLKYT